jgi:hypothetical protein
MIYRESMLKYSILFDSFYLKIKYSDTQQRIYYNLKLDKLLKLANKYMLYLPDESTSYLPILIYITKFLNE